MRATTSASNIHRRMRCPGSHWAEFGLPEEESEFSAEGTLLHDRFRLAWTSAPEWDKELSPSQRDVVQSVVELAQEILERVSKEHAIDVTELYEEGHERELWLHRGLTSLFPGHCDFWRWYPRLKLLVIIDAKFGFIVVESAEANMQLRTYAAQASEEWDADKIIVAIAQPRANFEERITIAGYERSDINASRRQLYSIWDNSHRLGAPLVPGDEQCRYCKAKTTCEAYREQTSALAERPYATVAELPDDQFRTLVIAMMRAKDPRFQQAVADEARRRLIEDRLPGFALKDNAPRRSITNQADALAVLTGEAGQFTAQEIAEASTLSVGELEKLYRHKHGCTAHEAKRAVNTTFSSIITRNTPAPSIVEL